MADPFVAEIRIFPFNFAPEGLGVVRRPAPAAVAEHRAVLAARHDLRRRRQVELRAARPAGPRADAPGPGPGPVAARPRRDRRQRDRDAARVGDPVPLARAARRSGAGDDDLDARPNGVAGRGRSAATPYQTPAGAPTVAMATEALAPAGGDQPHNNLQPYLTFYFCIALQGVFPPRRLRLEPNGRCVRSPPGAAPTTGAPLLASTPARGRRSWRRVPWTPRAEGRVPAPCSSTAQDALLPRALPGRRVRRDRGRRRARRAALRRALAARRSASWTSRCCPPTAGRAWGRRSWPTCSRKADATGKTVSIHVER